VIGGADAVVDSVVVGNDGTGDDVDWPSDVVHPTAAETTQTVVSAFAILNRVSFA
jgi:hypothetical protein